jgi:hypothetical protein
VCRLVTNVMFENKFRRVVEYKQRQSENNLQIILDCLNRFDSPVSTADIFQHFSKVSLDIAKREAQEKYERGEIERDDIDKYIPKNTKRISLRTVQRALKIGVTYGSVQKSSNRYSMTKTGKRELMFKQFAQGYGNMSLNGLMDLSFPTINTLDKNLDKLVKIFGVYVVYALIEATRLIMDNKNTQEEHWHSSYFGDASNFKDGKFREAKLINTWIKDVFDPWHMLNIYLTAISNSAEQKCSEDNTKKEKTMIEQHIRQYQNLPQIVNVDSIRNTHEHSNITPSTLDLMFRRISEMLGNFDSKTSKDIDIIGNQFHYIKIRSHYDGGALLYELDSERIKKLKNFLKKQYPSYCECLQKIDESFYST